MAEEKITEIKLKKISNLIDSAKEAAQRVRTVFLFNLIASVIVFAAVFNTYFSWLRHVNPSNRFSFSLSHNFLIKPETRDTAAIISYFLAFNLSEKIKIDSILGSRNELPLKLDSYNYYSMFNSNKILSDLISIDPLHSYENLVKKVLNEIQNKNEELFYYSNRKLIDNYFERQFFQIPILGIRITTHDLPILGGLASILFLLWHYYASRREFRIVHEVFKEHSSVPLWFDNIEDKKRKEICVIQDYILQGVIHKFIFISSSGKEVNLMELLLLRILYYVPVFVLFFLVIGEVISIYFITDFNFENMLHGLKPNGPNLFTDYMFEQFLRYGIMFISIAISYRITKHIRTQTKNSIKLFEQMQEINDRCYCDDKSINSKEA